LGTWASNLRASYRKDELETEKIDKLNRIGFIWDLNGAVPKNKNKKASKKPEAKTKKAPPKKAAPKRN